MLSSLNFRQRGNAYKPEIFKSSSNHCVAMSQMNSEVWKQQSQEAERHTERGYVIQCL